MTNEEIVIRIQAGIDVADNMAALWEQNRVFIYKTAKRYQGCTDIEDLLQEGYLGLHEAVERWESDVGVKFLSYASHWIRQAMGRYIESCGSSVRIPSHTYQKIQKYKQFMSGFLKCYGRKPVDAEISHFMGLGIEQLEQLKKDARAAELRSLDGIVGGEDNDITLGDTIGGSEDIESQVLDEVEAEQLKTAIWGIVDSLEEYQAFVIKNRYKANMTMDAVAKERGVTRQAIRQQEAAALRELRKPSRAKKLRSFADEYITSHAFRGGGVGTFKRTWTSTTEYAALKLIDNNMDVKKC